MVDLSRLAKELQQQNIPSFFSFTFLDEVDSTNTIAMEWGKAGEGEGKIFLAAAQRAGRGRMGRHFFSPKGSGLYFSILLRPQSVHGALYVTAAAGVAMAKAVEGAGKPAAIKWVNDIMVENRKVCGILAKGALGEDPPFTVLGVGVNLCPPKEGFPEEIQKVAGSVFSSLPSPKETADLLGRFLKEFYPCYQNLDAKDYWQDYNDRNWLLGKTVTAGETVGVVTGIDREFRLLITDEKGEEHPVFAGEVTLGTKNLV